MAGTKAPSDQQAYVFEAELVELQGVTRTISVRADLTLVDLHYALQAAFEWDDDHLYCFWLDGAFWPPGAERYVHPCQATRPEAGPGFGPRSAQIRLDELELAPCQRLAYVFDFGSEWRVRLGLREVLEDDGSASPRLLASTGLAPPQYDPIRVHRRERAYASAEGGST